MINIYSAEQIKRIAASGKILASVLKSVEKEIELGISLRQLDQFVYRETKKHGAEPAFLGYQPDGALRPFGGSICTSLNEVVVHGFPSDYILQSGDVLKIDFGVKYKDFFSDAAVTIGVGKISPEAKKLIQVTKLALEKAVKEARVGKKLGDIGWIIQKTARDNNLCVIKNLTGHGIGLSLHEEPTILNYGKRGEGIELNPGMVLAIEPMLAAGTEGVVQRPDESWVTDDNSLSAHFEHTVVIDKEGARILTQ